MRNRHVASVLCLAALLMMAGCTSPFAGQSSVADPPGVEDDELQNVSELVEAHNETLADRGYVINDTFYDPEGARVAATGNYDQLSVDSPTEEVPDIWANETIALSQIPDGEGGYAITRHEPSDLNISVISRTVYFERYLDWGTYNRTGTTDCGENRCVVLEADEPNASSPDVENVTASVVVAPSGVIHRFNASGAWAGDAPPEYKQFDYEYRLVELGNVTVEKSEWVVEYL